MARGGKEIPATQELYPVVVETDQERLSAELLRERELFRQVLRQMPEGVIIAEAPSGRLVMGNEQVERIWRTPFVPAPDIEGYRQYKGFHPDGRPYEPEEWPLARSITTGEVVTSERIEFLRGDETRGMMEVSSAPLRDHSGKITAGVALFRDISEEVELQRERDQLSVSERRAHLATEAAHQRFLYVVRASDVLGASLDYAATLQELASLVVPEIADWCVVDLMDEPGSIRNVAVAHIDPDKAELARELSGRYPTDPDSRTGVPSVVRTGRAELYPDVPDSLLVAAARDPEHLSLLRNLGIRSVIIAPLSARGRSFGALTLVAADSGRRYGEDDVALAEELGERAGLAIDNALLFQAERAARARLRLLAEASEALGASLDDVAAFARLGEIIVREVADICLIDVLKEPGQLDRVVAAHRNPSSRPIMDALRANPPDPAGQHPAVRALRTGAIQYEFQLGEEFLRSISRDPEHFAAMRHVSPSGYICVPLRAGGSTFGVITLIASTARFDQEDVTLAGELARRAAIAIQNARLYSEQSQVAEALQRSLLPPELPAIPGLELAARYYSATSGSRVGGDFYDAFQLGASRWAVVVGDVCGRGPEAAAVTGLVRHSIRALAMREDRPSRVLAGANEAMLRSEVDRFCTAVFARIRPSETGARVTVARAGHPAPAVIRADGRVEFPETKGTLLGVFDDPAIQDGVVELAHGDVLVLFTDGLIERNRVLRHSGGLSSMLERCAGLAAEAVAGRIEEAIGPDSLRDDIALLVVGAIPQGHI